MTRHNARTTPRSLRLTCRPGDGSAAGDTLVSHGRLPASTIWAGNERLLERKRRQMDDALVDDESGTGQACGGQTNILAQAESRSHLPRREAHSHDELLRPHLVIKVRRFRRGVTGGGWLPPVRVQRVHSHAANELRQQFA